MKFLFVSYVFTKEFNDPESWLKRISAYAGIQQALSINHDVISIEQIDYEGNHIIGGVDYRFLKLTARQRLFPLKLHRYILAQNPDVVIIQGLHFPFQILQLRALAGKRIRIIAQHHAEQPYTGVKKQIQKLADKYIDAYLFASMQMGLNWVDKGNLSSADKIHEVMEVSTSFYPIDKEIARQQTGIKGGSVFLWAGRLNENKDPLTVIRAFLRFAATKSDVRLYMIYQTSELLNEIKQLLSESFFGTQVVLVGKIPHQELLYWFNSADFLLSASHYEGSGTVVCEAMACGCVPIVTNIDSFKMITDNGKCGLLYEVANEDALFSTLFKSQAIDLSNKREHCLSYFKSTLSFEAIASRIAEIAAGL